MIERIENLFVIKDGDKKIRVHLDHVVPLGKYSAELVFISINDKKEYRVSRAGMKYAERVDPSICFFMDSRDIRSLEEGDDIFVFYGKKIQAFQFGRWEEDKPLIYQEIMKRGKKTRFWIKAAPHLLLARSHDYKGVSGTISACSRCVNCDAIRTECADAV